MGKTAQSMSSVLESHPHLQALPDTLDDSQTGTPERRPNSIRRTATIDMVWPNGFDAGMVLEGRARDIATDATDATDATNTTEPRVLDEATMSVEIGAPRTVTAIRVTPHEAGIGGLVGAVGGSQLRSVIDRVLPRERAAATPLHLLLDDIAGTSLIGGFALSRRPASERPEQKFEKPKDFGMRKGRVICSGLRPEGFAQTLWDAGETQIEAVRPAGSLGRERDPQGWHVFPPDPKVGMRRHRRIDVWTEGPRLIVDSFFRDAVWEPDGSQIALHEYSVEAAVSAEHGTLLSVRATPRVLPFPECASASPHVVDLIGKPIDAFRTEVQTTLTELRGCTHLNDMLRCLAEVPSLAGALAGARTESRT